MNFKDATAEFWSTAGNHRLHPCGPTKKVAIGAGSSVEWVTVPKPVVEFEEHRASISEPETARAMFKSDWFCRKDGFILMADCLPDDVQIVWPKLSSAAKRKVATQLVDDAPESGVIAALLDSDCDLKRDEQVSAEDAGNEILVQCDVPGCMTKPFPATAKTALEILRVHKIVKHGGAQATV